MKKYEITEQQRQEILSALGECPAKYTMNLIAFFSGIKPIEEDKKDSTDSLVG